MSAALVHFDKRQNTLLFKQSDRFVAIAASTANVDISTEIENGDSFGGITLSTNDIILLKDQTTTSENGLYEVQAVGAATRHASFDSAEELTYARVNITNGTHANTEWFQANELTNLASAQSWSTDPITYDFLVPGGITYIDLSAIAGGGGGGRGADGADGNDRTGGGGGGGAGAQRLDLNNVPVTPGETITIQPGVGGLSAQDGTNTVINGSFGTLTIPGAERGSNGLNSGTPSNAAGGDAYISGFDDLLEFGSHNGPSVGGQGGEHQGQSPSGAGQDGSASPTRSAWCLTPASGGLRGSAIGGLGYAGSGGGGGACGMGPGGDGGDGGSNSPLIFATAGDDAPLNNYGAGGGGGGGGSEIGSRPGGAGGRGADGAVFVSY